MCGTKLITKAVRHSNDTFEFAGLLNRGFTVDPGWQKLVAKLCYISLPLDRKEEVDLKKQHYMWGFGQTGKSLFRKPSEGIFPASKFVVAFPFAFPLGVIPCLLPPIEAWELSLVESRRIFDNRLLGTAISTKANGEYSVSCVED
jgi:hypothetical protein